MDAARHRARRGHDGGGSMSWDDDDAERFGAMCGVHSSARVARIAR
jgi:hypothetical protein